MSLHKYTVLGNTFLIVDETRTPFGSDEERAAFARWALDGFVGIGGADNVLCLGPCGGRRDSEAATFRIFEKDGTETLSCGNGLLSAAALLARTTSAERWDILTELPTHAPHRVEVGARRGTPRTWVNMGRPRSIPPFLFTKTARPGSVEAVEPLATLVIDIPSGKSWSTDLPRTISLSGWLTFTGEPHLVFVLGQGVDMAYRERLFPESASHHAVTQPPVPESAAAGEALLEHLARKINDLVNLFPHGVHVSFVCVERDAAFRYRTWERAINQETLACGTAALAAAHVTRALGLLTFDRITARPHRSGRYWPNASLVVQSSGEAQILEGEPQHVFSTTVRESFGQEHWRTEIMR